MDEGYAEQSGDFRLQMAYSVVSGFGGMESFLIIPIA